MKKIILYCTITVMIIVGLPILYYYPRSIPFELVKEIDKPHLNFDRTHYVGFDYVKDKERLMFWMIKKYQYPYSGGFNEKGYDSTFVENLSNELDFKKYDYLIIYQKKLKELRYSPYLSKMKDGLYFDKKIPLIPNFNIGTTDKVYIYQIKKNNKYRALGP